MQTPINKEQKKCRKIEADFKSELGFQLQMNTKTLTLMDTRNAMTVSLYLGILSCVHHYPDYPVHALDFALPGQAVLNSHRLLRAPAVLLNFDNAGKGIEAAGGFG